MYLPLKLQPKKILPRSVIKKNEKCKKKMKMYVLVKYPF